MGGNRESGIAPLSEAVMIKEQKKPKGLIDGLMDFLKMLEEMEKKGLTEQVKEGELEGPSGSKIKYEYKTRIGLGLRPGSKERLAGKTGKPFFKAIKRMPTKIIKPEDVKEKEQLVEVAEKDSFTVVTVELPTLDEKALNCTIKEDKLKISAKTTAGKIEKEIPLPEKSQITKTAFKNGVLEIWLKKKKEGKRNG